MAIYMRSHRKIRSQKEDEERALNEAKIAREREESAQKELDQIRMEEEKIQEELKKFGKEKEGVQANLERLQEELKRINEEEEKEQGELKRINEEEEKAQRELNRLNEKKTKIQNELRGIKGEVIECATNKAEINSATSDPNLILVDAESLSLDDEFMKHVPRNIRERDAKEYIYEAIQKGVKNFYRPRGDVSLTEDGKGICYSPGEMPAVGKNYDWYERAAKEFMPERNSRLGTKLEYFAFLGVLIKKLIEKGKSIEWAWNAVCSDSRELGHYSDSENAESTFEPTGSREACGFCDLGNTYKILAWSVESNCFWLVGGNFWHGGSKFPLTDLLDKNDRARDHSLGVGWIVLS